MTSMVGWALKKITYSVHTCWCQRILVAIEKKSRNSFYQIPMWTTCRSHSLAVFQVCTLWSTCTACALRCPSLEGLWFEPRILRLLSPQQQIQQSSPPRPQHSKQVGGSGLLLHLCLLVKLGFLKHGCRHEVTELHCPASRIVPDTVEWVLH